MKLRERVGKLEQRTATASNDEGAGGWPLLVELYDDDEEAARVRAVAKAEADGRPVNMKVVPPGGIRYIIVDLRSLQTKNEEV